FATATPAANTITSVKRRDTRTSSVEVLCRSRAEPQLIELTRVVGGADRDENTASMLRWSPEVPDAFCTGPDQPSAEVLFRGGARHFSLGRCFPRKVPDTF